MAFTVHIIGRVRSPFREEAGTPIQPVYAEDVEGTVELSAEYAEGIADLGGYERIWLISWLDLAEEPRMKVVPYRDNEPRGIFATRAPVRPNPIGLSCVRLLEVQDRVLRVAGVDLLDGTPVLDIKPYVPTFDAFPQAKYGWLEAVDKSGGDGRRTTADERFVEPDERRRL